MVKEIKCPKHNKDLISVKAKDEYRLLKFVCGCSLLKGGFRT